MVAAAVTLVAGCTSSDSGHHGSATHTPKPSRSPAVDPDVRLAATVLMHERAMLERVSATARRHPATARALAGALAAHRAHVALLTKAVPDDTPFVSSSRGGLKPGPVPRRAGPALSALAQAESRLSGIGAHSSLAARSGPFARVLASMAAAASQQSVHLAAAAQARA
jgi:hypothetical protein